MLNVLHIEDGAGDARLVQALLSEARLKSWGLPRFELEWVDHLQAGLTRLDKGDIDVVLTDLDLPDSQAEEILAQLQARAPHVPIVVLTGREDEELARQSVRAGVQDYVFKTEATGSLLARTMTYAIERQQAKQALQQSQARYRQLAERALGQVERDKAFILDSMTEMVAYYNIDLEVLWANKAAGDSVGVDAQELVGRHCYEIWHQRDEACESCPLLEVLRTGRPQKATQTLPDGRVRSLRGYPVVDEEGEIIGLIEFGRDVTERVQTETALRQAEEMYRTLAESASVFIIVVQDGQVVYRNRAYQEQMGLTLADTADKSFLTFVAPEDKVRVKSYYEKRLRGEEAPEHYRADILTPDGRRLTVEVHPRIIQFRGRPATMAVMRDVTEQARAERILQQRSAQLEALREVSLEITAQLDLDQLLYSVTAQAVELLGGTDGGLYLYRPEQDVLEWAIAVGPNPAPIGTVLRRGEGLAGKVWQSGEPLIVDDYQSWEGRAEIYAGYAFYSVVEAPIRLGDEFLGVLNVNGSPKRAFSQTDAELLSLFAVQAAIAIRNARLYEQAQRELAERRAAEASLRESEARYRDLFDRVPVGLYRITPEGQIQDANQAMADMLGYPNRESLLSINAFELYPASEIRQAWLEQLRQEETLRSFEVQLRRYDGSLIWVTESARVVRDAQGGVMYQEGSLEDITERVQAEQALRESRNLLQSLIQSLPQNVFSKDLEGRFTYANQHYCALQSKSLEEILGKTDFDLHPPDLAEKYRQDDQQVIKSGQIFETVEEHQPREGEKVYVQVIKAPVVDAEGQVSGVIGIFWDVTEQRRAKEALAHERDLLHALMDNIPDTIYFKDRDSRFTRVNQAQARALGLSSPQAAIGKSDMDFFPPEQAEAAYAAEREIIETGRPLIGQVEKVKWADGQVRWVSATKVPIVDAQGRVTGIVGISRDITERVQAERALEEKARELARSNADLEQFAYVISHDLREPLRMVASYLRLLREEYGDQLDAEADEFIQYAVDGATRMQVMVRDLLEYSRLGRNRGSFGPTDCGRVLEHALDNLLLAVRENEAVITYDRLPTVWGDETQLEQLFQNLIGNAIKFRSQESPRVHVSAKQAADGWRFSVRDNGIGLDPAQADRIFEIFQRLHTSREYEGTGIGLAICKKIVERHGGRIWVESQPGQGATFYFTLPNQRREGQAA